MLRQHSTLVAEAIVAAEVGRMVGDASDPAVTVGDLITKYRLDWGTYTQGHKQRSIAAQHLRAALRKNPHLVATNQKRNKYTVYVLKDTPCENSSPQTRSSNDSPHSTPTNLTPPSPTSASGTATSSLSIPPTTASSALWRTLTRGSCWDYPPSMY